MKKRNLKWAALLMAIAASTTMMSSCSDNDDNNSNDDNKSVDLADGSTISGDITSNTTLLAGCTYKLSGGVHVKNGATLTIKPGVKTIAVDDDIPDYILIEQGSKIDAQGTADLPIVMTSESAESKWGGIHICGKAHTNAEGGKGSSEIGGAAYGGSDESDNSGVLRYIRLEYTGFALDEEHEANGISFYGVGNGTTVDHIEAYKGGDDGFEFFGGSVNVSNMVVYCSNDDSFDWTEGWNGTANNIFAYQENAATLGYDCDCLIEADNNEANFDAIPVSHPTINHAILIGNGGSKQGIRLRRGTQVSMDDVTVSGKAKCLAVESSQTEQALLNGVSKLTNVTIGNNIDSKEGIYTYDRFIADGNAVSAAAVTLDNAKSKMSWLNEGWIVLK